MITIVIAAAVELTVYVGVDLAYWVVFAAVSRFSLPHFPFVICPCRLDVQRSFLSVQFPQLLPTFALNRESAHDIT